MSNRNIRAIGIVIESYCDRIHLMEKSFKPIVSWHIDRCFYADYMYPPINTYPFFILTRHWKRTMLRVSVSTGTRLTVLS